MKEVCKAQKLFFYMRYNESFKRKNLFVIELEI